jgi:hypothetical protein
VVVVVADPCLVAAAWVLAVIATRAVGSSLEGTVRGA